MSEKMPYRESRPDKIEIRRDALLLRIAELRQAVKATTLDQNLASKELDELDKSVQSVKGLEDMDLFEKMFDVLEKTVDSYK